MGSLAEDPLVSARPPESKPQAPHHHSTASHLQSLVTGAQRHNWMALGKQEGEPPMRTGSSVTACEVQSTRWSGDHLVMSGDQYDAR